MAVVGIRFDESAVGAPFAYDQSLVLLSFFIGVIASYATLEAAERLRGGNGGSNVWHSISTVVLGGGVWSMLAIAMLAFASPLKRGYDPVMAALSGVAIVCAAGLALWIMRACTVRGRVSWIYVALGGAVLGVGLATALYASIDAVRVAGEVVYRPALFAMSVAIAFAIAAATLWLAFSPTQWWQRAAAAIAMAMAFSGMYRIGMAASALVASSANAPVGLRLSEPIAAAWIALPTAGAVMIALIAAYFDRRRELDATYEMVRVRKEVADRTANLQATATQLDAALAHAERASAAKSDFLAGMSHELRTPLNSILGYSHLLSSGKAFDPLTPKQAAAVQQIDQAGRHLLSLIDDVLDLARVESGRVPLSVGPVELAPLIEEAASMLQPAAISANVTVHTDAAFRGLFARADRRRLLQVLINLLSNGIKYNKQGGSVSVSCHDIDGEARIIISDTGVGIPAQHLADVFEPFSRLAQDRSAIVGSGVGLALCRRLIQAMRGLIRVDSQEGRGSTFTITLPIAVEADQVAPKDMTARTTVLYIEDNPASVLLMRHIMKEIADVELVVATGAREGLELARGLKPGLVLLDINLSEMDGYDVLRALRADENTADIAVFAITSNALPRDLERGVAAGFDHYIAKPLDIPQFIAAVDVVLAQPPARRAKRARVRREQPATRAPAPIEMIGFKKPSPFGAAASLLASKLTPTRTEKKPAPSAAKPLPSTAPTSNIPPAG
ncbi:MAG: response regulator [Proteobacteria bacterium]|nr:response regulator [Pseudomonadota bacterium]